MAKARETEWFGADRESRHGGRTTAVQLEIPGRKTLRVKTTGRDTDADKKIAELTARYKIYRGAAELAPDDDRELMEKRRDIAFNEMQVARHENKLALYLANPMRQQDTAPRPEQVELLQDLIDKYRGRVARLEGE